MNNIEDIEQMLKPQCEFKASKRLKADVMAKAREEAEPRRSVRLWPWVAAACVAGVIMMLLMPPKTTSEEKPLIAAKAEPAPATEVKQAESKPEAEPVIASVEAPKPRKAVSRQVVKEEPVEESVQMSEETRLALMMASLNEDAPQPEEINTEEEIRQLRKRGERLISVCEMIIIE